MASTLDETPSTPPTRASLRRREQGGVLHYLGVGLSGGLLALVGLIAAVVILIPLVTGSTPMTVLTSSMEPTLPPGTLIVVKPVDTDELARGDVITYQIESGKPDVVTHRIVSILVGSDGSRAFITKGDNNDVADALAVQPVQVRGTVWYSVPWLGHVNMLINGEARAWLVPMVAIALFLYAGWQLMNWLVSRRR